MGWVGQERAPELERRFFSDLVGLLCVQFSGSGAPACKLDSPKKETIYDRLRLKSSKTG
jgi:hypothetical protein